MASIGPEQTILIIGASARYAAQSAKRAGLRCNAVDLFGDWDLRQEVKSWNTLSDFTTDRLPTNLELSPDSTYKFLITGGMEKRVPMLQAIVSRLPLAGPNIDAIERTNDPLLIQEVCRRDGINFPRVASCESWPVPDDLQSEWLVKEKASAGGSQVRKLNLTNDAKSSFSDDQFLQQFVPGRSFSSLFYASTEATKLLGTTLQLIGQRPFACDARNDSFNYCGSIGPITMSTDENAALRRMGWQLSQSLRLKGVFGIDWVQDPDNRIWLIEINPRLTASGELLELAGTPSLAGMQIGSTEFVKPKELVPSNQIFGKAIVFSSHQGSFKVGDDLFEHFRDHRFEFAKCSTVSGQFGYADIPVVGTVIAKRQPVVTILETGASVEQLQDKLAVRAESLRERIEKLERNEPVRA